jgi:hypothetical protein
MMRFVPTVSVGLLAFALALVLARCGEDSPGPSGPAPTLAAPVHVSPPSGTTVENQPTLTIQNVTPSNGSTPTYHFQVSVSDSYNPIAAEQTGVVQGAGGETSWKVNVPWRPERTGTPAPRWARRADRSPGTIASPLRAVPRVAVRS